MSEELNNTELIETGVQPDKEKLELLELLGITDDTEQELDSQEDQGSVEYEEATSEQTSVESEPVSLEERLQALEEKYPEEVVTDSKDELETQYESFTQELATYRKYHEENHWTKGLPDIKHQGTSIYDMDDSAFDQFLEVLDDEGKHTAASNAAIARNKAIEQAKVWLDRESKLEELKELETTNKDVYEWKKVEKEYLTDIPELQPFIDQVTKEVQKRRLVDPQFNSRTESIDGKKAETFKVIRDLKLFEKLSKNKPKDEIKIPSAPDTKVVSKKVKQNVTGGTTDKLDKALKMSQKEFNKLSPKELDELLEASLS